MLILWGLGLGTDIRDVHILGGVVLCGGFGDRHRDVNMRGGQRPWSSRTEICMNISGR